MLQHEEQALRKIAGRLRALLAERLIALYAFGSRVRGDYGEWSDFDVLIVVEGRTSEMESEIVSVFVDEETQAGVSFSPVIKDIRSFALERKFHTPFYDNLMREGVAV